MHKRSRELIGYAALCGFVLKGHDGNEHYVLEHPNGERVRVASSPGDLRGDDNCRAEMRRKSGVTPPRPNAAKYRGERRNGFSMRAAIAGHRANLSGRFRTETERSPLPERQEHPAITKLRRELDVLSERLPSEPYPYVVQEIRRLRQQIQELQKLLG